MCERQPCIAESLFQGRGVRVQGCEEGGEGPPAPFWVAGPLSVGCESAISMGAPIAEALALVLTNLCLLICDRRVEEVAHRSTETGGTSAGAAELGGAGAFASTGGALPADNEEIAGTNAVETNAPNKARSRWLLCSARRLAARDLLVCGPRTKRQ